MPLSNRQLINKRTPLRRLLSLLFLSILIPLLVLELGMRFWFSTFGTEAERAAYLYSWDEISATLRFRGVPYLNYGLSPNYPGINSLGYRGEEIATPKPEGVFRIVAVGGSTTYGDLIPDWRQAYPAQLESVLREDYGYSQVEVVNAGVPANASAEILMNFTFHVLDLQPDLVIVYDAINDLAARALDPAYYAGIPGNAGYWLPSGADLVPSVLYRYLAINLGWISNPARQEYRFQLYNPDAHCCAQYSDDEIAAHFAANPPIYFERNLRSLVAVADANDVQVMFASWTYYPDETIPGFNRMALPYRQQAIAEHNVIMATLAEETSAVFFDLFSELPQNREFWFDDGVHMTPLGTHQQALLFAGFMVESGLLPQR